MAGLPYHLDIAFKTKNPVFLHSAPGVGKSSGVYEFCQKMHSEGSFQSPKPIDIRLATHDITDFKFPLVDKDTETLKWIVADVFPQESRDGKYGVLFLDELSSAPPSIQTIAYALLLDRKIPSTKYELPDGWLVVAAGNREEDQAVYHKLSSALCNRINHLTIKEDWSAFKAWADGNDITPEVIKFLSNRHGEFLYKYNRGDKAYPSPRTWERASDALKVLLAEKAPNFRVQEQMTSWLGVSAGNAFASYVTMFSTLPDPAAILEGKATLPSIDEIDKLFILSQSLAQCVIGNPNKYAKAYLEIILKNLNEEIAVDSLRRVLSDAQEKNNVMGAFQKEARLFKQVAAKFGPAISKLSLDEHA